MRAGLIFGDSIMRGLYLDEQGARKIWKNRFLPLIAEESGIELKNHAQVGATVERGQMLFAKAMAKEPLTEGCPVLLEFGGNDADFFWGEIAAAPEGEHSSKTPPPRFCRCYGQLIDGVRELGGRPVLLIPPPIDSRRYLDWLSREHDRDALLTWLREDSAIYRYQEMYALAVSALAREHDCPLIDIRSLFLPCRGLRELVCDDGLHPNAAGYELIWEHIRGFFASDIV